MRISCLPVGLLLCWVTPAVHDAPDYGIDVTNKWYAQPHGSSHGGALDALLTLRPFLSFFFWGVICADVEVARAEAVAAVVYVCIYCAATAVVFLVL